MFSTRAERRGGIARQGGQSRFERTFSKTHFYRTFNDQLVEGKQLSETDMEVLLRFLSRDKGAVLATAETLNNVVILSVVPIASAMLASGTTAMATAVFAVGLGIGAALTLHDALAELSTDRRKR